MTDHSRTVKLHGPAPYAAAVLHGGPGGAGEAAPVARELGRRGHGTAELIQTGTSVTEQVEELHGQIAELGSSPLVLIGWSWGAWLGCLLAARHPHLVSRLVLVGSGPFDSSYAAQIQPTRDARLTAGERAEMASLFDGGGAGSPDGLERMVRLMDKADSHSLISGPATPIRFDRAIFDAVWPEAARMRETGALLKAAAALKCPVTAIHGRQDPHPAEGVENTLRPVVADFSFILLEKCGHKPWLEQHARDPFFAALENLVAGG